MHKITLLYCKVYYEWFQRENRTTITLYSLDWNWTWQVCYKMDAFLLFIKEQSLKLQKLEKSSGNSCFDELNIFVNLLRNFWLFSSPLYLKYEYYRVENGIFRTFSFFKNISNSFTVLKYIHKRVRFSKAIQRAIPQKFRMSASMLKCETTPFCYTPKYATIVLRSSGALKHWLVSSVASLGGLARVGRRGV